MQIMEQLQGDRTPSMLEPSIRAGGDGSPRLPASRESSGPPFRRAMSWLVTVMIGSFAASAQAMYPVCLPDEADADRAEPTIQALRQPEPESDPAWSHRAQSLSFND